MKRRAIILGVAIAALGLAGTAGASNGKAAQSPQVAFAGTIKPNPRIRWSVTKPNPRVRFGAVMPNPRIRAGSVDVTHRVLPQGFRFP
jgi:hypothetical protein